MAFTIGLIIGFIFGLLGVIFLVIGLVNRKKAQTAKGWPTTQGTIVSTEIREHSDIDTEDGSTTINYEPVVQYSYNVMGVSYTGTKIGYGANRFDRGTAQKKLDRYQAGTMVTVHHNPDDPRNAVLEVEASGSKLFLVLGIIFLVLGMIIVCFAGIFAMLAPVGS
jgi:hypothetical protein